MARRRTRRSGAPQAPPRRPAATGAADWKNWLMIIFVGLMAVILIVTMLPLG
jgi:hypothetical protein